LLAAAVLVICCVTFLTRRTADENSAGPANTTYGTALKAAEAAKRSADAGGRKRWVLSLQLTGADRQDPSRSADNTAYDVEGQNSDVLVVTSNSMNGGTCSAFADSEQGLAAAGMGFATVSCRNRSSGEVIDRPLSGSE
jgi:hypothetical protein